MVRKQRQTKFYLHGSTYHIRDRLKAVGCKWDADTRKWYALTEVKMLRLPRLSSISKNMEAATEGMLITTRKLIHAASKTKMRWNFGFEENLKEIDHWRPLIIYQMRIAKFMMSKDMQVVHEKMEEINKNLTANDFSMHKFVIVEDEEGSRFEFASAFAYKWHYNEQDWIMVFTEHHGNHLFAADEITKFECFNKKFIDIKYHPNSQKPKQKSKQATQA